MKTLRIIALGLLATLAACSSEPPEQWGVQVNGEWLPVVDVHLHTGEWDKLPPGFQNRLTERVPNGFKWVMKPMSDWMLQAENTLDQMNGNGIYGGGLFALFSPHTTGIATNEFVAQQVATDPARLYGFASLRIDRWNEDSAEQLAYLEKGVQLDGMVGIKLAHAHQQFRFDDENYYGIYEIAGRLGKPMYLHTGTSPNPGTRYEPPYADASYLEEAIRLYPKAIFILGHTGYDTRIKALTYVDAAIAMAAKYDNVYLEPGALGADRGEDVIDDFVTRIKKGGVIDKLIYGSDGPQFPGYLGNHLEAYVAAMQRNGYTTEEMRLVLAENFVRVFNIPVPGVELAPTPVSAAAAETEAL